MAPFKAGCGEGASQRTCIDLHLRGQIPKARDSQLDRRCPVCGGNLSINIARKADQHVVITCHGDCQTAARDDDAPRRKALIREALIDTYGIDERCLGGFGKLTGKQLAAIGPGGIVRCHHDRALEDDGQRFRLLLKFPEDWARPIYAMARTRLTELDAADLPPDPFMLFPVGDQAEWYDLAARAGVNKRDRLALWQKWNSQDGRRLKRSVRAPST